MRLLIVIWTVGAIAFGVTTAETQSVGSIGIEADNDFFVPHRWGSDHEYTHGIRFWVDSKHPLLLGRLLYELLDCEATRSCRSMVEVGQQIYTPRVEAWYPVHGERPHAGWLYAGSEARIERDHTSTALGIRLGVLGPPSLAEDAQSALHRWFDFRKLRGWDNQLPFEPTLQVRWNRVNEVGVTDLRKLNGSAGYEMGAELGNVFTHAQAGLALQGCLGPLVCSVARRGSFQGYGVGVSARLNSRLVIRNVFLDGTVRRSHSVEKRRLVNSGTATVSLRLWRAVLEYAITARTREYHTEPSGFRFGSLRLWYQW